MKIEADPTQVGSAEPLRLFEIFEGGCAQRILHPPDAPTLLDAVKDRRIIIRFLYLQKPLVIGGNEARWPTVIVRENDAWHVGLRKVKRGVPSAVMLLRDPESATWRCNWSVVAGRGLRCGAGHSGR